MKNLTIDIDQARKIYNDVPELREVILNSFTMNELFPKPKTWEEILKLREESYWISLQSEIREATKFTNGMDINRHQNILPTKNSAEKILALSKIAIIADYYNSKYEYRKEDLKYLMAL